MRPLAARSLLFLALAGPIRAGQVETFVPAEVAPVTRMGTVGAVQMTVPALTDASILIPTPLALQPVLASPLTLVPVLPLSVVPAAKPKAAVAAAAPDKDADLGRAMFDLSAVPAEGAAVFEPSYAVVRRGNSRAEGWEVDGKPARSLGGGSFKDVLIHPSDAGLALKLFTQAGSDDGLYEKRREHRNLDALLSIGRTPKVAGQGALALTTPSVEKKTTGYIVQERIFGREAGEMLRDRDPAVRARALREVRALFEDLIAARIKLEDEVKMHENISIGRARGRGAVKAWVLDAGEAVKVAERSTTDKLLDRPDPLRAYYAKVLARLARGI